MVLLLALAALAAGSARPLPSHASATAPELQPETLARARTIRAEVDARYRRVSSHALAVTEAATTDVVESFTLLTSDLPEARIVPADNGIYFETCPVRDTCPYPARRLARSAADFPPRRLALELALRTLLETSASVVAVSLPTPRFILFIAEREELARAVDMPVLARALSGDPATAPAPSLQRVIDAVTRPRTFVALGLEATPNGRDTFTAMSLWPALRAAAEDSSATAVVRPATSLSSHASATATEVDPEALAHAPVSRPVVDARDRPVPRRLAATGARTHEAPARLNEVAHVYSLGAGEVRCPSPAEWEAYYGSAFAWGSTNLREDHATLAPLICEGALSVGTASTPLWQQAAGVWVLVHEAFHLRHWRFRRNEAKVACQAIVYFRDAATRLGASEEQAEELYPYALALHIRQTELFSWYRDRKCPVPLWAPPVP